MFSSKPLYIIDIYVDSIFTLILFSVLVYVPLMFVYFISLFVFTNGMKYFVARKPAVYQYLFKITLARSIK